MKNTKQMPMSKKDWDKVPITHNNKKANKRHFAPELGKYINDNMK